MYQQKQFHGGVKIGVKGGFSSLTGKIYEQRRIHSRLIMPAYHCQTWELWTYDIQIDKAVFNQPLEKWNVENVTDMVSDIAVRPEKT